MAERRTPASDSLLIRQLWKNEMVSENSLIETRYIGVGGWLLFFCISLTILSPLFTILALAYGFIDLAQLHFNDYPVLYIFVIIDSLLSLGLTAFSVYAVINLWQMRQNSVRLAKIYLWAFLAYSVLVNFISLFVSMLYESGESAFTEVVFDLIRSAIYFGIWYSYLYNSRRVMATYGMLDDSVRLPESMKCPYCTEELELEEIDRVEKHFTCPVCKRHIEAQRYPSHHNKPGTLKGQE